MMRFGEALVPFVVTVRTPRGKTDYATDSYPDVDAMFEGSEALYVTVFWRDWMDRGVLRETRDKRREARARLAQHR